MNKTLLTRAGAGAFAFAIALAPISLAMAAQNINDTNVNQRPVTGSGAINDSRYGTSNTLAPNTGASGAGPHQNWTPTTSTMTNDPAYINRNPERTGTGTSGNTRNTNMNRTGMPIFDNNQNTINNNSANIPGVTITPITRGGSGTTSR